MPVLIKIRENKNLRSTAYGKFFGRVVTTKTMTYNDCVNTCRSTTASMVRTYASVSPTSCRTVSCNSWWKARRCSSVSLGTFYLSVKSSGAAKEEDYNLGLDIKGLYLRFRPNRQDINDLSSKTLKKRASFMNAKDLIMSKQKKKEETPEPAGN